MQRIGEWSPEATGGSWQQDAPGPTPGARFVGHSRFPNGFESTVTCVVTEAERPGVFAWSVLDDAGLAGSMWRYDLRDGGEPGSTVVRHSFTHGPGHTDAREAADADPRALSDRLVAICRNMKARLCQEAIRLARVLTALLPDEPEALGMLALMLLHDARRASRIDAAGDLVTLADQDRSRWDRAQIAVGAALCEQALRRRRAGPFQLQAAIAACHATAPVAAETDWPQIVGLYAQLARIAPSAIVELNRAVAIGMADGPEAALPLVDAIAATGQLNDYHLLHATRADLLRRLRRTAEAAAGYRVALELAPTEAERRFLLDRLRQI